MLRLPRPFIFYTAYFLFPTQVGLFLNPRLPLLQTPSLWFPCVDVFFVILTHHSTEAMLEPHAKAELGMTQGQVGLAFLLMGGSYLTFTLLAGKVHLGSFKYLNVKSTVSPQFLFRFAVG